MSDNREVIELLKREGFSGYAAETYVTLLMMGKADGRKLASSTRVPFSKIYSVLKELENQGLVIKEGSRPAIYRPRDPIEALELLKKMRMYEESARLDSLARMLAPLMTVQEGVERASVEVIRDQGAALARALSCIKEAKFSLKAIVPPIGEKEGKLIELLVESLIRTGLKLQLVVDNSSLKYLPPEKGIEVKVISNVPLGLLIADSRSVVVLIYLASLSALYTDSLPLINLTELVFERLWEVGKDISAAASPRRIPRASSPLRHKASELEDV
ncbi:MAG: TrmB family transcriptional regulator [Thermoprotei archaeon]